MSQKLIRFTKSQRNAKAHTLITPVPTVYVLGPLVVLFSSNRRN